MMAAQLVMADNIGCRHLAHDIGMFAALEYELPDSPVNEKSSDPREGGRE